MNLSRLWFVVAAVVIGTLLAVDAYVEQMQPRPLLAASAPKDAPAGWRFVGHLASIYAPESVRSNCAPSSGHAWSAGRPPPLCPPDGELPATSAHLPYPGLELLGVKQVCESLTQGCPVAPKLPVGSGFVQ